MFVVIISVILFLLQSINAVIITDLPSYFPRCHHNDPNINACMLEATNQVRPYLKKGIPELNIPPLSPFLIPEISLELDGSALNYKSFLQNVTLYGLDDYKFNKFEYNPQSVKFYSNVLMPHIYMSGTYQISGKLLSIPIVGKGLLHSNITNSIGDLWQDCEIVTRKGVKYLKVLNTNVTLNIGTVTDQGLTGLFDGKNEELEQAINNVIKNNLPEISKELAPAVAKVMKRIFDDIIFRPIQKIPYDNLYPPL